MFLIALDFPPIRGLKYCLALPVIPNPSDAMNPAGSFFSTLAIFVSGAGTIKTFSTRISYSIILSNEMDAPISFI